MNPLSDFMEKAKGLTKNPLGIIALFISLIYGFACIVLSVSLNNLEGQHERLPLIWFIIIFPVLILIGFIFLVIYHHEKLYAPSDYKDEANFIKTLDAKIQTQRIQKEVDAINEDIQEKPSADIKEGQATTIQLIKQPDKKDIQSQYIIAEDLALRAFEQDKKLSVKRQSKISFPTNNTLEFDGIAFDKKLIYGIDVKFTVHRHLSKTLRDRMIHDLYYYSKTLEDLKNENSLKFIFIVVTESDNHESLATELRELAKKSPLNSEFILYSFTELKKRFGIE